MKFEPKPRILGSFSGGRTSAYMAQRIKREYGATHELLFIMANTGKEDPRTIKFARQCDKHFGLNLVMVEAVVNERGEGTAHAVVGDNSLSMNGEPFEEVIKKYGIPNPAFPHCTRELKTNPMQSYAASIGWDEYTRAIGIRADEIDRIPHNWRELDRWYPLADWGVTKSYVRTWWAHQPFDLELPEHHGNCQTCWKKSDRKLWTLAKEHPEWFEFFARMEATYPNAGAGDGDRTFFRRRRSVKDIFQEAERPFERFAEAKPQYELDAVIDAQDSCADTCEPWADREVA